MKLDRLRNGLIVSCQPVPNGPLDDARSVVAFARAAMAGGACAVRIESIDYVRAVRAASDIPIIGIVKQDRQDSEVRITPTPDLVAALSSAGADIVAVDATRRPRPTSVEDLLATIKVHGKLAMADCSDIGDAQAALAAGADLIGTTMSGYTGGPVPVLPDLALIAALRQLTPHVVAEGRFNSPELAAEATRRGAFCVVVGSALTRTEQATSWFRSAMDRAVAAVEPVLAIDIGGTKIAAAIVTGETIQSEVTLATDQTSPPSEWLGAVAELFSKGDYSRVGIAVSGIVRDGKWSALNPATLSIPDNFDLLGTSTQLFGVPVYATNDAQAAAWGEHRFGAGVGDDMVFVTVSTGVGGGVVVKGKLLQGLAGHFGLWRESLNGEPIEDGISGRWIEAQAALAGYRLDARGVFAASREDWARAILTASAAKVASLCVNIQLAFDPKRIVVGGGVGLGDGYLDLITASIRRVPPRLRPTLVPASLRKSAGLIGIADLAR